MFFHECRINRDIIARSIWCVEGQVFEHALDHRVKAARTDVFHGLVHLSGNLGQGLDAVFGEGDSDFFCFHQGRILECQRIVGFGQDAHKIIFRQST